jgi:ribokinase
MSNILVIGSSNTDMVVKAARFPQPGETIIGGVFFMFPGGKGANQAVAAARMDSRVCFICKVGNDVFGQNALRGFQQEGIDVRFASTDPTAASGVALITVNAAGQNEIVVASGANNCLSVADMDAAEAAFSEADVVLAQLETPIETVVYALKKAHQAGKMTILNPAPAQSLPDDLYPALFLITPNETEAEILTGITVEDTISAARAADVLLTKGVQNVIITLGAQGAFFKNASTQFFVPAQRVEAIDTTAAGDVFNGALATGLAEKQSMQQAMEMATRAAAISVTRMGAQASAPFRSEVS